MASSGQLFTAGAPQPVKLCDFHFRPAGYAFLKSYESAVVEGAGEGEEAARLTPLNAQHAAGADEEGKALLAVNTCIWTIFSPELTPVREQAAMQLEASQLHGYNGDFRLIIIPSGAAAEKGATSGAQQRGGGGNAGAAAIATSLPSSIRTVVGLKRALTGAGGASKGLGGFVRSYGHNITVLLLLGLLLFTKWYGANKRKEVQAAEVLRQAQADARRRATAALNFRQATAGGPGPLGGGGGGGGVLLGSSVVTAGSDRKED